MLSVTLSFDHALIDGAVAARFAARLRELVEAASGSPMRDDGIRRPQVTRTNTIFRPERWTAYLANGFWLLVPVLLLNALFADRLPAAFQPQIFWHDILLWISIPENSFRTATVILPLLLHVSLRTKLQRAGAAIYLAGLLAYGLAWFMQIAFPASPWSVSAFGLMAPAYTPLLWLAGIGLLADRIFVFNIAYRPWMYLAVAVAFLLFHNLHTALVVLRQA